MCNFYYQAACKQSILDHLTIVLAWFEVYLTQLMLMENYFQAKISNSSCLNQKMK